MPVAFFIVAGVVIVVGVTAKWYDKIKSMIFSSEPKAVPAEVVSVVVAIRDHKATPAMARAAAVQAAQAGHVSLGQTLANEAEMLEKLQGFIATIGNTPLVDCVHYLAPLPNVTSDEWTSYVRRSRTARPSAITPRYLLGAYQMSARELEDAGWMQKAHKGNYNGRKGVWTGDWTDGKSEETFLATPAEQYEALVAITQLHAKLIDSKHADAIGKEIESEKATLSGLLAVARRTGRGGLSGWVSSAEEREGFPETTAAYKSLNGIF